MGGSWGANLLRKIASLLPSRDLARHAPEVERPMVAASRDWACKSVAVANAGGHQTTN